MKHRRLTIPSIFLCFLGLFTSVAWAEEPDPASQSLSDLACDPAPDFIQLTRYLRALSLDLRGQVPTMDEVEQVVAAGEVPDALIDEWLDSDAFAQQAVRYHRNLLWNNVENVNLVNASFRFTRTRTGLHWRRNRAMNYRGETIECVDQPAQFGPSGSILTTLDGREGYVEIIPYWSNDRTPIKVCAFDAQDNLVSDTGSDCSTRAGVNDVGCGCRPSLRWCTVGNESRRITRSMGEAIDRVMFSIF